jgi:hypothetical protein
VFGQVDGGWLIGANRLAIPVACEVPTPHYQKHNRNFNISYLTGHLIPENIQPNIFSTTAIRSTSLLYSGDKKDRLTSLLL